MQMYFNILTGNRFFSGASDQEKAAQDQYNALKGFTGELKGLNTNVANRWDNYKSPFDYTAKTGALDKYFSNMQTDIGRTAAEDSANVGRGTASRLASQGVTGGSILNSAVATGQNQVNKNKFKSLSDLKSARLGLEPGLMNQENQDQFNITGQATDVDLQNLMNKLRQYGMVQSNYGMQGNAIGQLNDDTWLSDILAIANTGSKFLPKPTP